MGKAHHKLGTISTQLCWLFDGIIIGGGAEYVSDDEFKGEKPKDIDIIIPLHHWIKACKLIPKDAKVNSFGGFKFQDGEFEVDVWADDAMQVLMESKSGGKLVAFSLKQNRVVYVGLD